MSPIKPDTEKVSEAKKLIIGKLEKCQKIIDIPNLRAFIGGNSLEWVEQRGGAVGNAKDGKTIELTFNTKTEKWHETLEKSVCFAYGQAAYIDRNGSTDYRWQKLLSIVLGQKLSYELTSSEFRTEKLNQDVEKVTKDLRDEVSDWNDKFFEDGEEYPPQFGYKLARKLVDRLEIQEIIEMNCEETLTHVKQILEDEK